MDRSGKGNGLLVFSHCKAVRPGSGPRHIVFHPEGRFVYLVNEISNTVTVFSYDPATAGMAELQTVSTLPEGYSQRTHCAEIRIDPSGRFLYASNRGHDSIAVFDVGADGTLKFKGVEQRGIKNPRNFNITPDGRFCLVASQDAGSVEVFRINADTGLMEESCGRVSIDKPVCIRFFTGKQR